AERVPVELERVPGAAIGNVIRDASRLDRLSVHPLSCGPAIGARVREGDGHVRNDRVDKLVVPVRCNAEVFERLQSPDIVFATESEEVGSDWVDFGGLLKLDELRTHRAKTLRICVIERMPAPVLRGERTELRVDLRDHGVEARAKLVVLRGRD